MIIINIRTPLTKLLGFSDKNESVQVKLPYFKAASINTVLKKLAVEYSQFGTIYNDKNSGIIGNLLVVLDGVLIISSEQKDSPLNDDCEISFLTPYSGG